MRILSWLVFGALGFGIMCYGYYARDRPDPRAAWAHGLIVVGPRPPAKLPLPGAFTPVVLRLLPGNTRTAAILKAIETQFPEKASDLRAQLLPKLIAVPFEALELDESSLESGRLPAETDLEALAGPLRPSGRDAHHWRGDCQGRGAAQE